MYFATTDGVAREVIGMGWVLGFLPRVAWRY